MSIMDAITIAIHRATVCEGSGIIIDLGVGRVQFDGGLLVQLLIGIPRGSLVREEDLELFPIGGCHQLPGGCDANPSTGQAAELWPRGGWSDGRGEEGRQDEDRDHFKREEVGNLHVPPAKVAPNVEEEEHGLANHK